MKGLAVILITAALLLVAAATLQTLGAEPPNVISLCTVDGKSYYYNKTLRSWFDSRAFCIENGMQMATIETVSQAEFLKSRKSLNAFSGYFEIAGRDAQIARKFSWDTTGEALTDIPGLPFQLNGGELDYRTCISYLASESPFLNIKECPLAGYALCQI